MNSKHILASVIAILAVLGIYFGTSNVKPKEKNVAAHDHQHDNNEAPMMGAMMAQAANFDSLLNDIKKKILSPQVKAEVENIESQADKAPDNQKKFIAYESLGKKWMAIGQKGIAAHYFEIAGNLENSEKILTFAAHLYEEGMNNASNPSIRKLYADGQVASLNKVVEINPKNDSASLSLGLAMINQGDMMNGIIKIRDIADKNPENIEAQITLGKMSLQTNQAEKAIERAEMVIKVDKTNAEAHLIMGEAFKEQEKFEQAVEHFRIAKKLINRPEFDKEIENYIASFTKS
ncbi:MAG TPA: hypothetical protein VLZ83_06385 [Edaphocola sp.]|nr:hypothetical protein [Edaphocola sp.]